MDTCSKCKSIIITPNVWVAGIAATQKTDIIYNATHQLIDLIERGNINETHNINFNVRICILENHVNIVNSDRTRRQASVDSESSNDDDDILDISVFFRMYNLCRYRFDVFNNEYAEYFNKENYSMFSNSLNLKKDNMNIRKLVNNIRTVNIDAQTFASM